MISKQLYIVKLSSYIKEQLKFASFLGVEEAGGGGPKQPSEVSNIYLFRQKSMFFNAKFYLIVRQSQQIRTISKVYTKI